jgi:hypothetical protein
MRHHDMATLHANQKLVVVVVQGQSPFLGIFGGQSNRVGANLV